MNQYILALDQGTTSSRAVVFDKKGTIISVAQKEFTQLFPKPGWVEHDPDEIWSTQAGMAAEAVSKKGIKASQLAAIGITNQRETVVVWDKNTGEPVYNAIVWQDKRTADYCDELKKAGKSQLIREKTGLVIDSYFSGTKVKWILDNVEGAREKAEAGDLVLGTIDTWLIWKMTDGELHITDVTNACRSMLFNINTMDWDDELLELLTIPKSMLPEVKQSSEVYGHTSGSLFATKIPIAGIAGDQQAALFGQMCTQQGMVKNTYGTGCFMLMNIGDQPIVSENNLLTTVAWKINGKTTYALEGSIFIAGAVVQWLRDSLNIIKTSSEVEKLASSVDSSDGVIFVPAFAGLGAPHWNQKAQGTIFGLTRGSTDAHIARAALESIAYQTMDILKAMEADSGISIQELRVDGGATVNDMLMQFQADVLNTVTVRPKIVETTVMGAAYLAGLAVGYWESPEEIQNIWETDVHFNPTKERKAIDEGIKGWYRAIKALEYWTENP
ncbi:MAG: glycerol kinase GlpK [Muricauda sp.]|jgi:glycerol kinase|uniref:glycerol kinase GlpK n=1 Tax=Flagellimonas sp. TaxID=2058762 RepID=UPI001B2D5A5B|nr:glycerol kinase GlpK [Allomuricauda sp.]MBO6587655.1 glycerol kinase GlpK [Allomuricauda sp.]MBO6617280.1 glycerol kinase GlpK [Allomuricauda sp.]MBO6643709.1 glycerol kinase GlpK [Allomuricauda sp.]MBO6745615.1 glycerol kinase GlpK [Allomuricauda sp.]MBO6843802.1 glycerol kinase GlpK [Allomuricauda sp.]